MSLLLLGHQAPSSASLPNPEQSNTELEKKSSQSHLKTVFCERMKWTVAIEAGAKEKGQRGTRDRNGEMAKEGDLIKEGKRRQT